MAIAKLIFQVRMPIKYHQTTFAFQISHKLRHTMLWQNTYQYVYVIYHQMSFDYFDSFVITQLPQDLPDAFLVLPVYCLSAVFRCKYYVVFTQPFCVAEANLLYLPLLSSLA